jgi:LmbE family N-acetylglucosaminyl deacetylase
MKLSAADRLLILAPHPDDELLSSFKLMREACRAGAAVKVIFLTDGERNHLAHMRAKKKIFITAAAKKLYGLERRAEAAAVLGRLGPVQGEFWGLPDSGLTAALSSGDLLRRFRLALTGFAPTVVISPALGDTHPDHSAAAALAEITIASLPESARPALLCYSLHPGRRFHPEEFDVRLSLSAPERKEKAALAALYRSQYRGLRLLMPRVLWSEHFSSSRDPGGPRLGAVFTGGGSAWFKTSFSGRPRPVDITAFYYGGAVCERAVFRLNWKKIAVEPRGTAPAALPGPAGFQKFFTGPGGFFVVPERAAGGLRLLGVKAARRPGYFDDTGIVKAASPGLRPVEPVCVVIPCHNIEDLCGQAVSGAARFADFVIAVDDGSTDNTGRRLEEAAASANNVRIIKFPENRGKGAALLAGMRAALRETGCGLVLTMDGDMQHRCGDIPAFRRAFQAGGEFIIGYRGFSGKVPLRSRLGNNVINGFVRLFLNRALIDSQSGFRGFSRACAQAMVNSPAVRAGRYETEIDILSEAIRGNWRLAQVEIPTIYLDGNKKSSFRPVADSIRIITTFLRNMSGLKRK